MSIALDGIHHAAQQRAEADELRRKATNDLRDYCLAAKADGVSISQIAREAQLSRQAVYDLLADQQPS